MVAPLDRLAVRQISGRFLSQDERFEIADLRREGLSVREVARRLGRGPSTVSRELRRNASRGGYRPFEAHRHATLRRGREHRRRLDTNRCCAVSSGSCSGSGGVRSRSAGICTTGSAMSRRCGCVVRASTRPSTGPDRPSRALLGSHRVTVPRFAQAVTIVVRSSASSADGPGSPSRC